jgi:hypothetical protein
MPTNTGADILGRFIEPEKPDMPPEVARYVLAMNFRAADLDRMDELAGKSRDGQVTEDESHELEDYLRVSDLLALMQSKARRSLRNASPSVV